MDYEKYSDKSYNKSEDNCYEEDSRQWQYWEEDSYEDMSKENPCSSNMHYDSKCKKEDKKEDKKCKKEDKCEDMYYDEKCEKEDKYDDMYEDKKCKYHMEKEKDCMPKTKDCYYGPYYEPYYIVKKCYRKYYIKKCCSYYRVPCKPTNPCK